MSRRDALIGAGLTLGAALGVATIMVVGRSPLAESIGLVMFPGVLVIGTQWIYLRGCAGWVKAALIGGPFIVLFLIGLVTGLIVSD